MRRRWALSLAVAWDTNTVTSSSSGSPPKGSRTSIEVLTEAKFVVSVAGSAQYVGSSYGATSGSLPINVKVYGISGKLIYNSADDPGWSAPAPIDFGPQ